MSEINSKEKYKHLAKLEDIVITCISCGDCREAIDYTAEPKKDGVCVVWEQTPGFEPFFSRGKMQIIRSLWQDKLELSKDMAEVIYQCTTCNACAEACSYDMDNSALYEALRAELVDANCALDGHMQMNRAMVELLNPYNRDNALKGEWLKELNFEVTDATKEKCEILYYVGCTAALTEEIQTVAINTAKVLKKLGVDFSVLGENEVCCGSVAMRTGDRNAFNSVATKNYELFKKSGAKTIITSCAGCYRTLKVDYAKYMDELGIKV
ncbi:MAG: (Fe-S)-binding protein, partial [Promethearchaeota archaeon]